MLGNENESSPLITIKKQLFLLTHNFFLTRTVLLSVISLLNEPNTFSPANVDASVMYRRWKDSKGKDKEYENIIRFVFLIFKIN